jgi:hypothetical protein
VDELPELRSDEDVDALMARLRAKLATTSPPRPESPAASAPPDTALGALLAAHGGLASTLARAIVVLAETLDELQAEASPPSSPARSTKRRARASRRAATSNGRKPATTPRRTPKRRTPR